MQHPSYIPLSKVSSEKYPDYNSDNIFVFDEIFPKWMEDDHEYQMLLEKWEYGHLTDSSVPDRKPFFGRQLFHKQLNYSEQFTPVVNNIISALARGICPMIDSEGAWEDLYRVSFNGQLTGMEAGLHCDTQERNHLWTAVYFVNEADGDLQFYVSKDDQTPTDKVEFKKGRFVVFPSGYAHNALAPEKSDWRITIAIMFEFNTERQYK